MRTIVGTGLTLLLLVGGCPQPLPQNRSAVHAAIAVTATSGPAPFKFVASASGSASLKGSELSYAWDFDDGTTSDRVTVTHTYQQPGRYILKLRVTDQLGEFDVAAMEIRVQGGDIVAVITAEPTSGPAPLLVRFDAGASELAGDTILDYFWDFGDRTESRAAQPQHRYTRAGEYTVQLRIVTAGGLEAAAQTTITVGGGGSAALQFDGGQFALLPLGDQRTLTACTFEAWVKADTAGGTLATIGDGQLAVAVLPAADTIRLYIQGVATDVTVSSLAGSWHQIAVAYSSGSGADPGATGGSSASSASGGSSTGETGAGSGEGNAGQPATGAETGVCTLYLDGLPVATTVATLPVTGDRLTIGLGLRGKVAEVRFWAVARSSGELGATSGGAASGRESGLLGYWPFDEGRGQVLRNRASGGVNGTLGASDSVETADPAWSTDSPPR